MTQSIRNFFWWSGWSIGTKLPGCWQLQRTRTLHQQLTIIYCLMFRQHKVAGERERICKDLWTDTKRHVSPPPNPTELSECKLLTNWLFFQNSSIFIYLNSGYRWGWCHLTKLLRHLSSVQNSLLVFLQSTCHRKDMNPFCLHFGLLVLNVIYLLKLSNLTYISAQRF